MEVLLRFLYGATAVMAVPRRSWLCRGDPTADWLNPRGAAEVLNMFKVSAVPPRRSAVLTVFPVLRRSMTEPRRNHGDHAVQAPPYHRASGVTGLVLRRHGGTCSKLPPCYREGPRF